MTDLTNEQKLARIAAWQAAGFVHPLTCGNHSGHADLEGAIMDDGSVGLRCRDCAYAQKHIPEVVFSDYVEKAGAGINKIIQQREDALLHAARVRGFLEAIALAAGVARARGFSATAKAIREIPEPKTDA